eukprot:1888422-Heterocapsa_arctica.AAC.1
MGRIHQAERLVKISLTGSQLQESEELGGNRRGRIVVAQIQEHSSRLSQLGSDLWQVVWQGDGTCTLLSTVVVL